MLGQQNVKQYTTDNIAATTGGGSFVTLDENEAALVQIEEVNPHLSNFKNDEGVLPVEFDLKLKILNERFAGRELEVRFIKERVWQPMLESLNILPEDRVKMVTTGENITLLVGKQLTLTAGKPKVGEKGSFTTVKSLLAEKH